MPDKTAPRPDLVELLIDRHWAISPTHAHDLLEGLKSAGLAIGPHDVLDETQRARVEAVRVAKNVLARPTGTLAGSALPPESLSDVVYLSRFILTGSEFEADDDALDAAPVEVTGGHVCQPVPDMPAGEDPGPLGGFRYDKGGTLPAGATAAVTRTPIALHEAMRTAASHRDAPAGG